MRRLFLLVPLVLLCGCAPRYTPLAVTDDHPASPAAAVAAGATVEAGHRRTLDLASARPGPESAAPAAAPMDHSAHGEGAGAVSKPEAPGAAPAVAALYVCPMHPEVTSDKPDQRCPKCHMKLVKKESTQGTGGRP
jgi:hypothetical protein